MANNSESGNAGKTSYDKPYMIGIGASAGGLEALQLLFSALPPDTGFPYIVVQHLSPDYKSLLSEILQKNTQMPVIQAENGMEVRENHVYVIAPGNNMRIADKRLRLTPQDKSKLNLPIDIFFRSLAEESNGASVAVVLSGTGSDGSNGIKDVKERGGLIFAQSLETCKFDGMPRSAAQTGLVDAMLSPEEIAKEITHISNMVKKEIRLVKSEEDIEKDALETIYNTLKKARNIDFKLYKQATALRRIERRMILAHKESMVEYADFVAASPEEAALLAKDILIGVTSFFRDADCFDALKDKAISNILKNSGEDEQIRVWVAGCSTGEEAYTIAILFREEMESLGLKREVKIFGTDIDAESIATASAGAYGENILDAVPLAKLSRYFTRRNNEYVVNREIRQMIVFSPHNVFSDPPFGRLDLITCRNMMIYFQPVLQNSLFAIFHAALKDHGYLFLGKSEAVGTFSTAFPTVDAGARLFTHNAEAKIAGQRGVPFLNVPRVGGVLPGIQAQRAATVDAGLDDVRKDASELNAELFERFMPACVVVNERNEAVHFLGENGNYFHQPRGRFSNNVFDLITDGLKATVSTLLKEARQSRREVQYKDIRFSGEKNSELITATAMPLENGKFGKDRLFAIVFSAKNERGETEGAETFDVDRVSTQRITDLEQELRDVRMELIRSIADRECANEELQAANEELLTSNEELQSSNEELQSVNEELYTVNSEYQLKLTEVSNLNDDITNFLSSTMVGIIFVDQKLHIHRFTEYVTEQFSIMEQDIGRSLNCAAYNFVSADIEEICRTVLRTLTPDEREISTNRNKVFFTRVAPYRSSENKILGCVITLVDITSQKTGQRDLAAAVQDLSFAREAAVDASNAKSEFLSRMSHDMRTPLNAIIGSVALAIEEKNTPETAELLSSINVSSKYLLGLINDILDLSKIESGKIELHEEPFPYEEFVRSIKTVIKPLMDAKNIELVLNLERETEVIMVDKLRYNQVFFNLLSNAAKYTPAGGRVELKSERIPAKDGKFGMRFYIRDNGIGMSPDFLDVCFEAFSQEKTARTAEIQGSGLGLAIVKHLVDAMGGSIAVKSEIGRGTEYVLELYAHTAAQFLKESIIYDIDDTILSGCRILLVDDNDLNLTITSKLLKKKGCNVETAVNGAMAVNAFSSSPEGHFDIIVTDVRMPVMDGLEEARTIRLLKRTDAVSVPIIALTADAFEQERDKTIEAGMNARLVKPVEPDMLYAAISGLVRKKRDAEQAKANAKG